MTTYVSLNTAIQAKLSAISGLTVYGKDPKKVVNFPAAAVFALSHSNEFNDLAANKRTYQFMVRFYFRTDDTNDPDYEGILEGIVDSAITAIEHDVTLGGACDYSMPSKATWKFGEKEVPLRICELTIDCVAHIAR